MRVIASTVPYMCTCHMCVYADNLTITRIARLVLNIQDKYVVYMQAAAAAIKVWIQGDEGCCKENGPETHLLQILVFDDQYNQIRLMNLQVIVLQFNRVQDMTWTKKYSPPIASDRN